MDCVRHGDDGSYLNSWIIANRSHSIEEAYHLISTQQMTLQSDPAGSNDFPREARSSSQGKKG